MREEEKKRIQEISGFALEESLRRGAEGVRITADSGIADNFAVEQGELEELKRSYSSSLSIELFAKGRYGCFTTNELERERLSHFISHAISITGALERDACNTLPKAALYYRGGEFDLGQYDTAASGIATSEKIECTMELYHRINEKAAKRNAPLLYTKTMWENISSYSYITDSQGFTGESLRTDIGISAQCTVKGREDARPEGYKGSYALFAKNLNREEPLEALDIALSKTGAAPVKGGVMNVVIENITASRIVTPILDALDGITLYQRNSFLLNSKGKRIFSPKLTIYDNPHIKGMSGSRYFDGEGLATHPANIIESGVVTNYYINTYASHKMGLDATIEGPSAPTILPVNSKRLSFKELLSAVGEGVLITDIGGGSCNPITGDFSYSIEGFVLRRGERCEPICGMNISGNIIDLWNNFSLAADDPIQGFSWQIPSLAFENATIIY